MVLLDTKLCSLIMKKAPPKVLDRLLACPSDGLGISVITLGELVYAVARGRDQDKNRQALTLFLAALHVVDFSAEATLAWSDLRVRLEKSDELLDPSDVMIAAHALSLGAKLATSSPKRFRAVPGLSVENWTR